MARPLALAAAIAVSLLAVSGAGGAATQQTPKRGGTVVIGPYSEPRCLNPLLAQCEWFASAEIRSKVLPPAFLLAPDQTYRETLVARVTFTRSRPFTLTYVIRPEARWSDGVSITARDFDFTLRMIRKYGNDFLREEHRAVRRLVPVDAKTFRVVLRPRFAGWRGLFSNVLPWHALRGEDLSRIWATAIDNPKTGRPIGSGPFLVERYARDREVVLVRNPRYWGRTAHVDRIVIRFCRQACIYPPPEDAVAALREGRSDLAVVQDAPRIPELRRVPGVSVSTSERLSAIDQLTLNLGPRGHPALRSKLVRRALAYAIDRQAIARGLFRVVDRRYEPTQSAVLLSTSRYYVPNWTRYRHDPVRARRLLLQAGCRTESDGVYACAGERLSLRLVTTAGSPGRERSLELIRAQLRRVGIEARAFFVPGQQLFAQLLPGGDFDLAQFNWIHPIDFEPVYGCSGDLNWSRYCQRLVTRDLDQATRILDAEQQARVLNRADRQLAGDVPVIPLFEAPFVVARRSSLRNVVAPWSNLLWNAEDWWLAPQR